MAHYRAVMATTVDCEGCRYDSKKECKSQEGCVKFNKQRTKPKEIPKDQRELVDAIFSMCE